ncbi:MAG: PKD domain-containing protein [Ruminococcus sp.]|nr:PKD domain-containing protein [Ruminococcus sp.]
MKKIISIMLTVAMMLTVCVLSVNATTAPAGDIGDANCDGTLDITDATFVMRVVAGLEKPDLEQGFLSDTDRDGLITIFDATNIQRYHAGLRQHGYIGYWYNYDMLENDFYSDYESGMAMVGVPVTFTVNAEAGSPVLSYELYIDDVCVVSSNSNSITYTFEEAGEYDVEMRINALYSTGYIGERDFKVVEPYESETPLFKTLYITGKIQWGTITYGMNGLAVHVDAIGGTAPYQYKFVFERPDSVSYKAETVTKVQEYSENNVYELEPLRYSEVDDGYGGRWRDLECKLTVYIKDANGVEISREMPIVYSGDVPVG